MPAHNAMDKQNTIRFLLNGEVMTVTATPTTTLLAWLREHHLTGSKEGCAEGDCGACTVVIGELDDKEKLQLLPINACIRFLPTLDGRAVFTIESVQNRDGTLHPVQQAMVDVHASQCGFCTPGFVMSLLRVYLTEEQPPGREAIAVALAGNLCRCTGYRPILDAGERMYIYPRPVFDRAALVRQLKKISRTTDLSLSTPVARFTAPRKLATLLTLKAQYPQATILAGATDVGLWVTKQLKTLPHLLFIGEVAELKTIHTDNTHLTIGAGVSLEEAYQAICHHYPQLREMWLRFASPPIRHAGTLGGNVANGSPIGDSMPALLVLKSEVLLASTRGERTLPLEDFYLAYQKKAWAPDEIVRALRIPIVNASSASNASNTTLFFRTYKVAKRYDSDISAVCAAFAMTLAEQTIQSLYIAYGGMAATPKRATQTEHTLIHAQWTETTLARAMTALAHDYQPLSDMRASSAYRLTVAQNLLKRFYLETRFPHPLTTTEVNVFAQSMSDSP